MIFEKNKNSCLFLGDSKEVLIEVIPNNSIDSVICDPPYGLKFMNMEWDRGVPGVPFWKEMLRVAKPGAYLLAFGGTRTFHRLAVAIEDSGWEIRDTLMWVYGCLSEDTEILTINGWEHYHKNIEDNPVLCYNIEKNSFEFHKPERSFIYENEYPAYRIQSDNTDQIVSRNHRVLVERNGRKVFALAETLEQQETIPFLESLQDLPETIPNVHEGTSIQKQDLFKRMCCSSNKRTTKTQVNERTKDDTNNLSTVWNGNLEAKFMDSEEQTIILQQVMQGKTCYGSNFNSQQVQQNRNEISRNWIERCRQSCVERWSNLFQNTWKLCWGKVCSLPRRIFGDVSQRWLCYGTSVDNGSVLGEDITEVRDSSSYRSQSYKQPNREFDVVQKQSEAQTIRSTKAKVTEINYNGKVWCVEVPTGSFVARRNGKIFITGNSGFPKGLDVSKAIDKEIGVERMEVIGINENVKGRKDGAIWGGGIERPWKDRVRSGEYDNTKITAPATSEAKQWDGWGTALKPAHEPVIVGYKPLTAYQFVGILLENIRSQLCQYLPAKDAEKNFIDTPVKLREVVRSVPEHVRIYELENSGNVKFVAKRFMSHSVEFKEEREGSVPIGVKENGSQKIMLETVTLLGRVDDFLNQLMDTFTLDTMEGISENIVLLWNNISDDLLSQVNIFTTRMGIRLTTTLRTLSLFLSQVTSEDIGNSSLNLSPNFEPIILARKPLSEKTVASNVLKYGTGGLNIDACRIGGLVNTIRPVGKSRIGTFQLNSEKSGRDDVGRWPTNLILECICDEVIESKEERVEGRTIRTPNKIYGGTSIGNDPGHKVINKVLIHTNPECPCYMMDEQSGILKSGTLLQKHGKLRGFNPRGIGNYGKSKGVRNEYIGNSRGASRYFKQCNREITDFCNLYPLLIQLRHDIMISKNTEGDKSCLEKLKSFARTVEKHFLNIKVTKENTAQLNVEDWQIELKDLDVRFVENQCDLCETHIALVLAKIKTLDFSQEELQVIQDYILPSKSFILFQSLVSYAENPENIDITQIIIDLLKLFGCVNLVITNSTQEIKKLGMSRFQYVPKASRKERDEGCEDNEWFVLNDGVSEEVKEEIEKSLKLM